MCIGKLCFFCEYRNNVVIAVYSVGRKCRTHLLWLRNARGRRGERLHLNFPFIIVLARTRARQEVFVFILHIFTGMPQMVVAQRIRGEGFWFLGSR